MRNVLVLSALLLTTLSASAQKDMKATVMAANQTFMDAFAKGATTMSTLYTTDAELLPPNSDVIKGNSAIGAMWKGAYDSGVKKAKLETIEAEQSGDRIIEIGRYTLYGANEAQLDAGKYVVIWKQEGNQWKLHRDIWNTSKAAAVASK